MSSRILSVTLATALVLFSGCGALVESPRACPLFIPDAKGNVMVYSGGQLVADFPGAEVLYPSPGSSNAVFIRWQGKIFYIQSDCLVMEVVK